jgi:hypothetical protein
MLRALTANSRPNHITTRLTVLRLAAAALALVFAGSLTSVPEVGASVSAEARPAKAKKKHPRKSATRTTEEPARPPVKVDPQARETNRLETGKRRGSSTPPPPYSGSVIVPRPPETAFGPGTILPRTDQLKPRPLPRPSLVRPLQPPRGWDRVPGPGHGPGTYITPIYPGTIGPTGP